MEKWGGRMYNVPAATLRQRPKNKNKIATATKKHQYLSSINFLRWIPVWKIFD